MRTHMLKKSLCTLSIAFIATLSLSLSASLIKNNHSLQIPEFSQEEIEAINKFPVQDLVKQGLKILQLLQQNNFTLVVENTLNEKGIAALEKALFGTEHSETLHTPGAYFFCKYLYPFLLLYNNKNFFQKSVSF